MIEIAAWLVVSLGITLILLALLLLVGAVFAVAAGMTDNDAGLVLTSFPMFLLAGWFIVILVNLPSP